MLGRHFKRAVLTFLRLKCREAELVGQVLLVKALILYDVDLEDVVVNLVQIGLVEDSPVDLERANTRVLDLKCLRYGRHVSFPA